MFKKTIKIITFSFLIVVLLTGLIYWLELVNILPTKIVVNYVSGILTPAISSPQVTAQVQNDTLLLDRLRLEQQSGALQRRQETLNELQRSLELREEEVLRGEERIRVKEEELDNLQLSLNLRSERIENKDEGLRYNVQSLLNIPPENAVKILVEYDDQLLVDTLMTADLIATENQSLSLVPLWLSLMEPERASDIQKKIIYR